MVLVVAGAAANTAANLIIGQALTGIAAYGG